MRRGAVALLAAAMGLVSLTGSAGAACTKPHHYAIGSGPMPSGETWSVTARVKNNGSCKEWLFDLEFALGEFGSAETATGIPAGGHVPREYFKLGASDYRNPEGSEAAFYGYTDEEGTKVLARMKDGKNFAVEPQLAPAPLRKRVDWLRSFRFFVYFHPTESPIEQVSVFTRGGRLIYRTKSVGGGSF